MGGEYDALVTMDRGIDFQQNLTTIWFPDEPLNAQDRLFNGLSPAARKMLTCKIEAPTGNIEPDSKIALFNIILTNG